MITYKQILGLRLRETQKTPRSLCNPSNLYLRTITATTAVPAAVVTVRKQEVETTADYHLLVILFHTSPPTRTKINLLRGRTTKRQRIKQRPVADVRPVEDGGGRISTTGDFCLGQQPRRKFQTPRNFWFRISGVGATWSGLPRSFLPLKRNCSLGMDWWR